MTPRELVGSPSVGVRLSRRTALAGALAAGAAAAAAAFPASLRAAGTTRAAANPVVLTLVPNLNFPQWPITQQDFQMLHQQALGSFQAANPNIRVELFPNATVLSGLGGATMAAMLAGDGPDVFADWVAPPFVQNGLVLDVSPYVKADNVDLQEFLSGQMAYYQSSALYSPTNPHGLYMLPGYLNTSAMVVNLTIVDQLGLKRPSPDWTYEDWTKLWRATTDPGKKRAGGSSLLMTGYNFSGNGVSANVLYGFGGEYVDPADTARSYLDAGGSIRAGQWFYGLMEQGVIPAGGFSGTRVTLDATTGDFTAFTRWNGFDWDYYPPPRWPVRAASWGATDFYAIWAGTKYPEAAWQLLKAISVGRDWQYFITRVLLMGPVQRSLWTEWARVIQQAAPPVAHKNLNAFVDPVIHDEVWVGSVFRYATQQASSIISKYDSAIMAKQTSVEGAYTAAARQIDAVEATGPALAGQVAAEVHAFTSEVAKAQAAGGPILYPAPSVSGLGNVGTSAGSLVHTSAHGVYTVSGAGRGLQGPADGCTFAGGAARKSMGTFTCRLVAVTAGKSAVPQGAKVGLMARGSLTDAAALTAVNLTLGPVATPGVHFETRSVAGTNVADTKPGAAQGTGLLGATGLVASPTAAASNDLLKPLWLRLVLNIDHWTAYTSLDGKSWQQAGPPSLVEMVGAWVGVFVTSHQSGQYVHATFDSLQGFAPDHFIQIGAP